MPGERLRDRFDAGVAARVAQKGQHGGITLARKDCADDPKPGRAGDVGNTWCAILFEDSGDPLGTDEVIECGAGSVYATIHLKLISRALIEPEPLSSVCF